MKQKTVDRPLEQFSQLGFCFRTAVKQILCEFERCAQEINTALEFVVSLSRAALVNVNILSNLPHSQNLHCEIPEWWGI